MQSRDQTSYPAAHFGFNQKSMSMFEFSRLSDPLYHLEISPQTCFNSNSTSDEADEQQIIGAINERKQRRMVSNRESARRSRMRKQKHLDELWSQVVWLRSENKQLIEKVNNLCERHDEVVHENGQLKEETSELRQILTDMQLLNSPYNNAVSDVEDVLSFLKPESLNCLP